jgi:hypothetical protein
VRPAKVCHGRGFNARGAFRFGRFLFVSKQQLQVSSNNLEVLDARYLASRSVATRTSIELSGEGVMSAPVREPDGPLNYAPKEVRHPEPDPNAAGPPPKGDAAPQSGASVSPPMLVWRRSKRRDVFAGDVAIAELRGRLALVPDRLPEPQAPRSFPPKRVARRFAGVAVVAAVGVIGYWVGTALDSPTPRPPIALASGQSNRQGLESERPVPYPPQSAVPASAGPPAAKGIVLQSNEQKSGGDLADNTIADRKGLQLAAKSYVRQHAADEIGFLSKSAAELMANRDFAAARLMYQRAAEEGDALAAVALAETYDPLVLGKSSSGRGTPDVALAQSWYEKARELGSAVASERLERLARLPNNR